MSLKCCFHGYGRINITAYEDYQAGLSSGTEEEITGVSWEITSREASARSASSKANPISCQISALDTFKLTVNTRCHGGQLALAALAGKEFSLTGGSTTDLYRAYKANGSLLRLSKARDTSVPLVVTSVGGLTTYVQGVDYEIIESGNAIRLLKTGTIAAPTVVSGVVQNNLAIEYTALPTTIKDMAAVFGKVFRIEVMGENGDFTENGVVVGSGQFTGVFFMVRLNPSQNGVMVSSPDGLEPETYTLVGEVLRDEREVSKSNGVYSGYAQWTSAND